MAVAFIVREPTALDRAFALARALPAELAPAIFCRDAYPEHMNRHVPGLTITQDADALGFDVQMYARRTAPAVIVIDGEPAPFDVDANIQQFTLSTLLPSGDDVASAIARAVSAVVQMPIANERDRSTRPTGGASHRHVCGDDDASRRRFAVRMDDVTDASDELLALCELCAARRLRVSLEVIPYLCRLDEETVRRATPDGFQFEVSQHGYAHLPRRCGGRKAEFVSAAGWRDALERSSRRLSELFPATFAFGFSAPYDFYPPGLTQLWADVGGTYASVIWAEVEPAVGIARLTDDPWDWSRHAPRPIATVVANLERAFARDGAAGLVLHPQPLSIRGERDRLGDLLDAIVERPYASRFVSELALAKEETRS